MTRYLSAAALGLALLITVPTTANAVTSAASAYPSAQSQCPEKAPAGAIFVKRVQPPYGLAYEVWRDRNGKQFTIYC